METKKSNPEDLVALLDCSWFNQLILVRRRSPHPAAVSGGGGGGAEGCGETGGAIEKRGMPCLRERRTKSEDAYSKCEEVGVVGGEEGYEERKMKRMGGRRRRRSKSMTELEMEEVKGFMDLGFVFREEDKGTALVSIIPGLLLLGENGGEEEEEEEEEEEKEERRPYLSEAWKWRRGEGEVLRRWRMPASGSEVEVKNSLRLWAHAVASAAAVT